MLDVAFNHRQRGDIQKLKALIDEGRLGRPYYAKAWWLRRTGIPTVGSWFTRAELAGGGPLVDIGVHVLDWSLFLLGDPEVVAVSASTYDLLATNGFGAGSSGLQGQDRGRRRRRAALRRRGPRLGLHAPGRRRHAARRSQLGRPPPRRRRVRHHPLRHRRRRGAHRRRLRAEGRPGPLHRRRRRGRRHPRARQARPCPQGGHRAVRGQDPRRRLAPIRRLGRPPPSPASWTPATVSAAEQREVRLDARRGSRPRDAA